MGNANVNVGEFPLSSHPWKTTSQSNILYDPITVKFAYFFTKNEISPQQFQTFKLRSQFNDVLVEIFGIISSQSNTEQKIPVFSCTKNREYRILMERVQYRLPDLGSISFNTGLFIMKQSLFALRVLYRCFGSFYISEDMIGFTEQGKCKVWFNTDYQNYNKQPPPINWNNPQEPQSEENPKQGESQMVEQLFELIENRMLPNLDSKQKNLYFSKKKQILCGEYRDQKQSIIQGIKQEDERKYEYSLSGGLILINVLCSIQKLDCKTYRIEMPEQQNESVFLIRRSREDKKDKDYESPNGKSKLSLKPFAKDYWGIDDMDLDEKSRRNSYILPKSHRRDLKTGSYKNLLKKKFSNPTRTTNHIFPIEKNNKNIVHTSHKLENRKSLEIGVKENSKLTTQHQESVRVGIKNMYTYPQQTKFQRQVKYINYDSGAEDKDSSFKPITDSYHKINAESMTTISSQNCNPNSASSKKAVQFPNNPKEYYTKQNDQQTNREQYTQHNNLKSETRTSSFLLKNKQERPSAGGVFSFYRGHNERMKKVTASGSYDKTKRV